MSNARGITDGGAPENFTAEQMSRVEDALKVIEEISLVARNAAWDALPTKLKVDYIWSKWSYTPAK